MKSIRLISTEEPCGQVYFIWHQEVIQRKKKDITNEESHLVQKFDKKHTSIRLRASAVCLWAHG